MKSRHLKILTIVHNLKKGGTQRAAQTFAEAYRKLGHDSRVFALYGLGTRYDEIKTSIKIWSGVNNENISQINRWSPDLIHLHSHGLNVNDVNKILDNIQTKYNKTIETNVFSRPSKWAERIDISFQLSTWANWLFIKRGGEHFKTAIAPYPVKYQNFNISTRHEKEIYKKHYGIQKESIFIGRIGQAYSDKWSLLLLDVFNELAEKLSNIYMLIVNPPECILNEIHKSFHKNRIIVIDEIIGDEQLASAYSAMDIMIHIAERGESFGMVLAESILCGTPVITLSTPWADNSQCEVVSNMIGGYVVNNKTGILKAIRHYLENNCRDELVFKGIKHVRDNYYYIDVAELVIKNVFENNMNINKKNLKCRLNIDRILRNTFDHTNLLTRIIILLYPILPRELTKYTSNYKSISKSLKTFLSVLISHILKYFNARTIKT